MFKVKWFVEKLLFEVVKEYLVLGDYVWNVGMFVWSVLVVFVVFVVYVFEFNVGMMLICVVFVKGKVFGLVLKKFYLLFVKILVDYVLFEKFVNVVVLLLFFDWGDVGLWLVVLDYYLKDKVGNVFKGFVIIE